MSSLKRSIKKRVPVAVISGSVTLHGTGNEVKVARDGGGNVRVTRGLYIDYWHKMGGKKIKWEGNNIYKPEVKASKSDKHPEIKDVCMQPWSCS